MFIALKYGHAIRVGNYKMWTGESSQMSRNGRYPTLLFVEHYGRWAGRFTMQELREQVRYTGSNDYSYEVIA